MISIFSKFKIGGGSERRCVELANGLVTYCSADTCILCREDTFPEQLKRILHPSVRLETNCLSKPQLFYDSSHLLTVNSDSREFTKLSYWQSFLDVSKLRGKPMLFLFNFIISPSQNLCEFEDIGAKVGIITTNKKFFDEVSDKDKFSRVRHFPRMILESPIEFSNFYIADNPDPTTFKIHMLSKAYDDKWNDDIPQMITNLSAFNSPFRRFQFNLMGLRHSLRSQLERVDGVNVYGENKFPVHEFLKESNLFVFFPSYRREEPWARVIGEAMASSLPILALNRSGGTAQQVINGNNGFLCDSLQDFVDKSVYLFTNPELAKKMGKNSRIYSQEFSSENISRKFLRFMNGVAI